MRIVSEDLAEVSFGNFLERIAPKAIDQELFDFVVAHKTGQVYVVVARVILKLVVESFRDSFSYLCLGLLRRFSFLAACKIPVQARIFSL